MDWGARVEAFFWKAGADPRLSPIHISLYFVLLNEVGKSGIDLVIPVKDHLMRFAKISSTVTYHRCLRELHEYGYINYRPSFVAGMTRVEMI